MKKIIYLIILISTNLFAEKGMDILIRPLTNNGDTTYGWFKEGFHHSISYNLGMIKSIRIQTFEELGKAYGEEYELNKKNIKKIPKKLNIDILVSGTYAIFENKISLNIKLKSKGENKKTAFFTVSGSLDELDLLEIQFIENLITEGNSIVPANIPKASVTEIEIQKIAKNKLSKKSFQNYSTALTFKTNPNSAMKYYIQAIGNHVDYPGIYLAAAEHAIETMKNYLLAISYLEKALLIQTERKEEDTYNYLQCVSQLALAHYRMGNRRKALTYYITAREAFQKQDISGIEYAYILNNLGVLYLDSGSNENAMDSFLLAKRIYETMNLLDSLYYVETINNIGIYYFESQNDNAREHLVEAKKLFEKGKYTANLGYASCLTYLGNYYFLENEFSHAIEYYHLSLDLYRKIGINNTSSYASLLNNVGLIYMRKGELNKAREIFEKSKSLLEYLKLQETWTYATALANLSNTYYLQKEKNLSNQNLRLEWKMQRQIINAQTKYNDEE